MVGLDVLGHESCGQSVWVTGNVTSVLSGHHHSYFNVNTSHLSQICMPFSKTSQHCLHLQNFIPHSCSLCRICSHRSCGHPVLSGWHPRAPFPSKPPLPAHTPHPPCLPKIKILCFYLFTLQLSVLCLGQRTATGTRDTWKILKTANPGSNQHIHRQQIYLLALCSFENTGPSDRRNDIVGGWYRHLGLNQHQVYVWPGRRGRAEDMGYPKASTLMFFTVCKIVQGRDMAVRYETTALLPSAPHAAF